MPADQKLRNFFRQLVSGVARNLPFARRERAVAEVDVNALVARYLPTFEKDVRRFTERLLDKSWTAQQWREQVEVALRNLYLTAAIAGAGHVGRLMPGVLDDVTNKLAAVRPYLNKFVSEVERMPEEERDLDKLTRRLLRYGKPAVEVAQRAIDRTKQRPRLPFYPKDGTTQCLDNCLCHWEWSELDGVRGDWDVTWKMMPGEEHCETCLVRAEVFTPLKIRGGVIITRLDAPGIRAHR